MEDNKEILTCRNRIFKNTLSLGKNISYHLKTDSNHVYRVTGLDQVYDILTTGYIKPKVGKLKGGHNNEVFWTQGDSNLFYYDKRPVLELPIDKISDIGAKNINDLSGIWIFDEEKQCYINKIKILKEYYNSQSMGDIETIIKNKCL